MLTGLVVKLAYLILYEREMLRKNNNIQFVKCRTVWNFCSIEDRVLLRSQASCVMILSTHTKERQRQHPFPINTTLIE